MFLSVWCREESPFSTRKTIRRSGKGSRFARALTASQLAFLEYCRAWRVARADPVQNTAVRSDISTFILVGRYDPVTPREYADRAASTLSRSQVVEFPSTGYAVLIFPTLCWLELVQGFLARPGAPLGTACLARDYPPLAFDAAVPARASGGSKAP